MHKLKIGERTAAVLGWDGIWKGYPIDGVIVHEKPLRKYGHLLCVRPEEPRQRDGEEAEARHNYCKKSPRLLQAKVTIVLRPPTPYAREGPP